ncbi:MAG TPA: hypothetical protein VF635_17495 [Propionibacteriaceae bacterium]|jgi:hypothetical protein
MNDQPLASYQQRSALESTALRRGLLHGLVLSLYLWVALLGFVLLVR